MFRIIIVTCAALLGCVGAALAQLPLPLPFPPIIDTQGTPEERAACFPDVQRYCRTETSDSFRVLACLQNNRQRITLACRGVLQSHGQ